jgi:hypothetical protein
LRGGGGLFGICQVAHKARSEEQPPNKCMQATAYGGA